MQHPTWLDSAKPVCANRSETIGTAVILFEHSSLDSRAKRDGTRAIFGQPTAQQSNVAETGNAIGIFGVLESLEARPPLLGIPELNKRNDTG